jgi:hypothetical protein
MRQGNTSLADYEKLQKDLNEVKEAMNQGKINKFNNLLLFVYLL